MRYIILALLGFSSYAQESNTLFDQQWYLKNTGQSYQYRDGDLDFPQSQGIDKIDINWVVPSKIKVLKDKAIVAVIDTGLDYNHPDLKDRIWIDQKRCPDKDKIDPRCYGRNLIKPTNPKGVMDKIGHGTHVSGIIAANDNKQGIVGAAHPNVVIMPLKVLNKEVRSMFHKNRLLSDYYAAAIRFAIKEKVDVINISGGFPKQLLSKQFNLAISEASAANIPIIASAGNNSKDMPVYPCHFQDVICVGSIDNRGNFAKDSNFSQRVDILAPGEHIIGTYPLDSVSEILRFDDYEALEGTSQAAPLVAAVVANMKLQKPDISIDEIKAKLYSTARPIEEHEEKFSNYGLVDMKACLSDDSVQDFVHPLLKGDDKIIFHGDSLNFKYTIPVKNFSPHNQNVSLSIEPIEGIEFDQVELPHLEINKDSTGKFVISGKVSSLDIDHLLKLSFSLKTKGFKKKFKLHLIMTRLLKDTLQDSMVIKSPIKTENFNLIRLFQKQALMKAVIDTDYKQYQSTFYTTQSFPKTNHRIVSINHIQNQQVIEQRIQLSITDRVSDIFRADFNLDGEEDYLVSGIRTQPKTKEKIHYFRFYNSNLEPLYGKGKSIWTISAYDPLVELVEIYSVNPENGEKKYRPIKLLEYKEQKLRFSLMKYHDDNFGEILVPVLKLKGINPLLGSIDPVDFYTPRKHKQFFVLTPDKKGVSTQILPKPLFTNLTDNYLREIDELDVGVNESILLESAYQDQPNLFMISVGRGYNRRYFQLRFNNDLSLKSYTEIKNDELALLNSQILPIYPYNQNLYNYIVNISPWQTRNTLFNGSQLSSKISTSTVNWLDKLFYPIGTSKVNEQIHFYYASRYWIHFFNNDGAASKVPIKRESSFKHDQFSELTQRSIFSVNNQLTTGITIDSTRLYGDFAYAIQERNAELVRPIRFTIKFDHECNYFSTQHINNEAFSTMLFVCNENNRPVLKTVPLRY